jgi:nucleotidyltransferase AbiEii toxin of type IV toxin-antitoxin system
VEPPRAAEFDPGPVLQTLVRHGVDFVLIGGIAAIVLGSSYSTSDLDVAYARDRENLERLAEALRELEATLRGAPHDLPFQPDAETLEAGLNFTLATAAGNLDVFGEPAGAPRYEELKRRSSVEHIEGVEIRVASIDHLIAMKEAAGRPKDALLASQLRALSDKLRRRDG